MYTFFFTFIQIHPLLTPFFHPSPPRRKKMMRDLQQAFLDQEDPAGPCQLVDKAKADGLEPNILDMLKDPVEPPHPAAAASTAPATNKKPGFWKKLTMRKSKRWFHS